MEATKTDGSGITIQINHCHSWVFANTSNWILDQFTIFENFRSCFINYILIIWSKMSVHEEHVDQVWNFSALAIQKGREAAMQCKLAMQRLIFFKTLQRRGVKDREAEMKNYLRGKGSRNTLKTYNEIQIQIQKYNLTGKGSRRTLSLCRTALFDLN